MLRITAERIPILITRKVIAIMTAAAITIRRVSGLMSVSILRLI
jgi:hypothetical protein